MRRFLWFGFLVTVPSWLVLAVVAGNVGLQRSVTAGAQTLLTEHPAAGLATIGASGILAWLAWPVIRGRSPLVAAAAVLAWSLIAGVVVAPIAIGELEPGDAARVIAATTVCGLTVLAALCGAWHRARSDRGGHPAA